MQAMKDWHKLRPGLFRKQPYHLPGCDSIGFVLIFLDSIAEPVQAKALADWGWLVALVFPT